MALEPLTPTHTAHLFAPLHRELMALLRHLSQDDWLRPTVAGAWRVRDVAAHLLEVDLRNLSVTRDGHVLPPDRPIAGYGDIAGWINHLNASGVETSRRFSARVILDLLDVAGVWVADMVEHLPPDGPAVFGVAWAGETQSANWMDVGREYTERWHHQAQIRDAIGVPRLLDRRWLEPLLDLSVRVLPVAFAPVDAVHGTAVTLDVVPIESNMPALSWTVVKGDAGWQVWRGAPEVSPAVTTATLAPRPSTRVRLAADDAWRMFYNALDAEAARQRAHIEGDVRLAAPLLAARSVMV